MVYRCIGRFLERRRKGKEKKWEPIRLPGVMSPLYNMGNSKVMSITFFLSRDVSFTTTVNNSITESGGLGAEVETKHYPETFVKRICVRWRYESNCYTSRFFLWRHTSSSFSKRERTKRQPRTTRMTHDTKDRLLLPRTEEVGLSPFRKSNFLSSDSSISIFSFVRGRYPGETRRTP